MVHHSKFLFSALVVSAMAVGANAQVTTSAISGKVLDETKAPVIGATVVAIHEPSGTLYGAVTNVDGRTPSKVCVPVVPTKLKFLM